MNNTTPTTPDKSAPEKGMELLPCMICGKKPSERFNPASIRDVFGEEISKPKDEYSFRCSDKSHVVKAYGETREEAHTAWNTRSAAQETGQQDGEKAEALLKEVRVFIKAMPVKIEDDHMVFADDANRLKRLLINVEAALSAPTISLPQLKAICEGMKRNYINAGLITTAHDYAIDKIYEAAEKEAR